ncbi:Sorting nexin-30 [Mortierella claussenii]|nr:Sorting nexin-30 [Mortierella claussenii]
MNRTNMGRGPGANGGINPGNNPIRNIPAPTSATSVNGLALTVIGDLRPSMRGFNLECILLEKAAEPRRTYDNQLLTTFLAADKTGSIVLVLWGDDGVFLRNGDVVRIQSGETKLYRGLIQLSTSKFGSYKKIGEDTMLFNEKPNWSEFEWIQDPNSKPGVMMPVSPQHKMGMPPNGIPGIPPMIPGVNMQQQRNMQGNNPPSGVNQPFRGDQRPGQRPFPANQGGNSNGNPHGNMPGPNAGGTFNNNKGSFNGPAGMAPTPMQQQILHNGNGQTMGGPSIGGPGSGSSGPGGNRPHHGGHHAIHQHHANPNQNQNQSQNQNPPLGGPPNPTGGANAHPTGAGGPRHSKHSKHNKAHRDLDAPDAYPSPRTGLANSVDEFAREMKLVSSHGGVGLGVGGMNHGGGGGGGGGPGGAGHMRKKPKIEME